MGSLLPACFCHALAAAAAVAGPTASRMPAPAPDACPAPSWRPHPACCPRLLPHLATPPHAVSVRHWGYDEGERARLVRECGTSVSVSEQDGVGCAARIAPALSPACTPAALPHRHPPPNPHALQRNTAPPACASPSAVLDGGRRAAARLPAGHDARAGPPPAGAVRRGQRALRCVPACWLRPARVACGSLPCWLLLALFQGMRHGTWACAPPPPAPPLPRSDVPPAQARAPVLDCGDRRRVGGVRPPARLLPACLPWSAGCLELKCANDGCDGCRC